MLYFVGVFVAGVIIGLEVARGHWMEVVGAIGIFALLAVAVGYQTRKEGRL